MLTIAFILQVIALVFLFLATINIGSLPQNAPRIMTFQAGMFFWLLSLMVGAVALHAAH